MKFYILNENHDVVETDDVKVFGSYVESDKNRRVAATDIGEKWWVSTIFLGLDYRYGAQQDIGRPIVFETMVFPKGSWSEDAVVRTCTWEEAQAAHDRMVKEYQTK